MPYVIKVAIPFDRDSTIRDIKVYGARLMEVRYIPGYPTWSEEQPDSGSTEDELHPHGAQLIFETDVKEAWVTVGNTTYTNATWVEEDEELAS